MIGGLGAASRGTRGSDAGRKKEKFVAFSSEGREGSVNSMSMLQLAATRSA